MHEKRNKDINRAQASTLYRLSQVLKCGMEDLRERQQEGTGHSKCQTE